MKQSNKVLLSLSIAAALTYGLPTIASAMHIMEGYLPAGLCVAWGVICLPFLVWGWLSIRRKLEANRKVIVLLAISGAFIFVLSSLKIPSVTGSCSHMTGTGLGAILFGGGAVSILGLIVLVFQAILLAHGGLTSLGANTFSMAVAGPLAALAVYKACKALRVNRMVAVFLAASLGDLFTYCVTAFQLALAFPSAQGGVGASMLKFLAVFSPTQLPLAVIEGILTVVILMGLETYAKSELAELGHVVEA